MSTKDKVKKIISETLGISVGTIADDMAIGSVPEWDSVGNLAIINALESAFQVEFDMEDLFELTSLDAIVNKLNSFL